MRVHSTTEFLSPGSEPVTGLPNRAVLHWYLEYLFALTPGKSPASAVLVIALDEAETMRNDFGDGIFNTFMQIVALRFRELAKPGQFVSVSGADEFAFVISDCTGRVDCIALANDLLSRVNETMKIDGYVRFSSAKIGIAFADFKSETPAGLLHRAQTVARQKRLEDMGPIRFANANSAKFASAARHMFGELQGCGEHGEVGQHNLPPQELRGHELHTLVAHCA